MEQLGIVTTQTGTLIVVDTGYLNLWSHDRTPVLPTGTLDSEEATEQANSFVDLRIVGTDAERAGRLLDMSWNSFYVYDQHPDHSELQDRFRTLVRRHKL